MSLVVTWNWAAYLSKQGQMRWEAYPSGVLSGSVMLRVNEVRPIKVNGQLTPHTFPVEARCVLGCATITLTATSNDRKLAQALAERLAEVVLTPEFKTQVHKACMEDT